MSNLERVIKPNIALLRQSPVRSKCSGYCPDEFTKTEGACI
uniref:Uncharacterized protein n=1 Tax=Arundo donax TaxID=35708 RepID=A0A0A8YYQ0_ARUDO